VPGSFLVGVVNHTESGEESRVGLLLIESVENDSNVGRKVEALTPRRDQNLVVVKKSVQFLSDFLREVMHVLNNDQLEALFLAHFSADAVLK
jgi:hypothetical protein